ncbi:MAG: hypothetical protein ACSNEK_06285 [Parachlamydiaceae bacterium]
MTINPIHVYSDPYADQKQKADQITNTRWPKGKPIHQMISKGLKKYRLILANARQVGNSTVYNIAISRLSAPMRTSAEMPKLSWFKRIFYVPLQVEYNGQTFWVAANKRSLMKRLGIEKKELGNAKNQSDLQNLVSKKLRDLRVI